jgi:hypothetical protein
MRATGLLHAAGATAAAARGRPHLQLSPPRRSRPCGHQGRWPRSPSSRRHAGAAQHPALHCCLPF